MVAATQTPRDRIITALVEHHMLQLLESLWRYYALEYKLGGAEYAKTNLDRRKRESREHFRKSLEAEPDAMLAAGYERIRGRVVEAGA